MPYSILGLPLHPLIVHLTVVLVPLVAIGTIVAAVVPRTRRYLRWPVAVGAVVSLVSVYVTTESGEHLERQLPETDLIRAHTAIAGGLTLFVAGLAVTAVALLVFTSPRVTVPWANLAVVIVAVLAVAASVGSVVQVVRIGHSGADAAWNGIGDLPVRSPQHGNG